MPNILAYIVLFGWPVVVYILFRRMPPAAALGWSVLAGYLLLPMQAGLELPGVPTVNKDGIPVLSAGIMLLFGVGAATAGHRKARQAVTEEVWHSPPKLERQPLFTALLTLFLFSPVVTVLANSDPVPAGPWMIPGLELYDAGAVIGEFLIAILPFLLARRWLASPESHVLLLRILVLAMLGYSLLVLFEVRMSPQLNLMIYGFFQHDFEQHMRGGGFRPLVFLPHGLWLAILQTMAILAAAALWRQRVAEGKRNGQWQFVGLYLLIVLSLSNSLGALAITLLMLPVVLFLGVRTQLLVAGAIAGTVLLYPMLRASHVVPVEEVLAIAKSIDEARAASLEFRLVNEEMLLERAALRPLVGWGMWGRSEVYDPETGRNLTVTDGAWIIAVGRFGWLGYLAAFGLLTLPILLLMLRARTLDASLATSGLAMVMAANLLDLIPNATITPVTWLIGGALVGRLAYRVEKTASASRRDWKLVTDFRKNLAEPSQVQPVEAIQSRRPRTR